ncbi:hypothetical protein TNCV_5103251 [Trichonephila clavipes]|nr:hypothetical protein TNCV_5103251 [Trichonephila clavipes]
MDISSKEELRKMFSVMHCMFANLTQWRDIPGGTRLTVPNLVYATLGPEVQEQMFRSGGQSDAKNPSVKFPSKLLSFYRSIEAMKG